MNSEWLPRIWPLMQEAFPPDERRTYEGQEQIMKRPDVRMRVLTEGGEVTGFIVWWDLQTCVFIEHLAISSDRRGGGRGAALLHMLTQNREKPVVLEIEPPAQSAQALRRLHFYRKNGFVINDFPYKQYPLKPGDEPMELAIMSYRTGFNVKTFYPLKQDIYRTVYNLSGNELYAAL